MATSTRQSVLFTPNGIACVNETGTFQTAINGVVLNETSLISRLIIAIQIFSAS